MTKQTRAEPSAKEYAARFLAETAALQRYYCNVFKFWQMCPFKTCRKMRACSGDAKDCLKRRAPDVPREVQWQARQQILAATPASAGPPERMAREFLPGALASAEYEGQRAIAPREWVLFYPPLPKCGGGGPPDPLSLASRATAWFESRRSAERPFHRAGARSPSPTSWGRM